MPAKKSSHRPSSQGAKPRLDQELVDDQKFQQKLEAKRFTDRIEREANEAILCPTCASSNWRMRPKYFANFVANDLVATMACRKCKRAVIFSTYLEEEYPEDDQDEDELEDEASFGMSGINRGPRRRRKLDFDQRLRLLPYLR